MRIPEIQILFSMVRCSFACVHSLQMAIMNAYCSVSPYKWRLSFSVGIPFSSSVLSSSLLLVLSTPPWELLQEVMANVETASVQMRVEKGFSNKNAPVSQPAEPLPEEIPLGHDMKTVLLALPINGRHGEAGDNAVVEQTEDCAGHPRHIHGTVCLEITEPKLDDEVITGNRDAYVAGVLARYHKTLAEMHKNHLGYQFMLDFDYEALSQLQRFHINNVGDPFIEGNIGFHSRQFEVGVLDWFARLWELEKDEYWGYVTNGGTEGNLHGILVGRELLPDGILYASKDSHYSVFKAARILRMELVKVDTLFTGEIDCADLKRKLMERKDKPAILNVNIGTTIKGAIDDLDLVLKTLEKVGYNEDRFYIHVDGALFGFMMPFVRGAPKITFKKPIGSVTISGHKTIGCPSPCGVQITRMKHINLLSRNVEYIGNKDATISGSRDGHAPVFLWYTLNRKGYRGFQKDVQHCLRNACYLKERLLEAGEGVLLNNFSNTVVFERPSDEAFILKWQLACQGKIAHVVVMPSTTVEKLNDFIGELIEVRKHARPDGYVVRSCIVEDVGPENCACSAHRNITSLKNCKEERKHLPSSKGFHKLPSV